MRSYFPQPVSTPEFREGHAWKASEVSAYVANAGWIENLLGEPHPRGDAGFGEFGLTTLNEKLEVAKEETDKAYERFDAARKRFNGEIRNEMQSVEATSRKISAEFERINKALLAIQTTYTSGGFVQAVENAERLARALHDIQALQSSKLMFAVIENQSNSQTTIK